MRFEEIKMNEAREVNGGKTVALLGPSGLLITYIAKQMSGSSVGVAVGALGSAIGSILR